MFNNYLKPGPGINKDAPPKPAPIAFFETVGRKFWELLKLNFLNLLLSLPMIIILFMVYVQEFVKPENDEVTQAIVMTFYIIFAVAFMAGVGFAPIQTGTSYLLTQYSIENPTFFLYDFFRAIKKNIKQSLVVMLADFAVMYLLLVNYKFYSANLVEFKMIPVFKYVVVLTGIIYFMMHYYIYPIMFTYEVKTVDLFKKSFLFVMVALPQNLLITLIVVGVPFLFMLYPAVISYLILFIIGLPFLQLLINFFVNRLIKKYTRPEEAKAEENEEKE